MPEIPFISICIPGYKQPESLRRLLQSVKEQTFKDFEVNISDDSPDSSLEEVANEFSTYFPVNYRRNSVRLGSPANWNASLAMAKGTWIKEMHNDDWFSRKESLEIFVAHINIVPDIALIFCSSNIYDINASKQYLHEVNQERVADIQQYPAYLFHGNVIGAPSAVFFKRSPEYSYNPKLIWHGDIELYIRIILKHKIIRIPEPLVTISSGSNQSLTSDYLEKPSARLDEYIMSYYILKNAYNKANLKLMQQGLLFLLQGYGLGSIRSIRNTGYSGKIPFFIRIYSWVNFFSPRLSLKIIGKWVQPKLSE